MRVDETLLSATLADLDYKRLKRYVYRRGEGADDIEHFLYFFTFGTPKDFLACDFGLRNLRAESFGVRSIVAHGGGNYSRLRHDMRTDCCMRFSLGRFAGWGERDSLFLPDLTETSLTKILKDSVHNRLFSILEALTGIDKFKSLLLTDVEPCRWVQINGAIRAAQIVSLARQIGTPVETIRAELQPYKREIAFHLKRASVSRPEHFIDAVIADSEAEVPSSGDAILN